MKNMKNGIMLALTVAVLILCGILPAITAKIEDYLADEKINYGEMKTVQLMQELNDTERLYLLKTGTSVAVSEERAKLKSENLREVVNAALSMYVNHGYIIGNAEAFSMECEPLLYYSNQISSLSGIFWKIRMELWDDWGQSISMYLDDQTGKVLLISYECLEPIYDADAIANHLKFLFADYQSCMDWYSSEDDVVEIVEAEVEEGYYGEENEEYYDAKIINCRMGDLIYGEIGIQFIMTENGFRIQIE